MVNVPINWVSIIGIAGFIYGLSIQAKARKISLEGIALNISGSILFFQGWRLDPLLQIAYFLNVAAVILTYRKANGRNDIQVAKKFLDDSIAKVDKDKLREARASVGDYSDKARELVSNAAKRENRTLIAIILIACAIVLAIIFNGSQINLPFLSSPSPSAESSGQKRIVPIIDEAAAYGCPSGFYDIGKGYCKEP